MAMTRALAAAAAAAITKPAAPALMLPLLSRALTATASQPHAAPRSVRRFGFGSHVSDNDPETIEREMRRNLEAAAKGAARKPPPPGSVPNAEGWNPKLASDSEAVVKAERVEMSIEEMVEEAVRELKEPNEEEEEEEERGAEHSSEGGGGGKGKAGSKGGKGHGKGGGAHK